jgi:hypothetical protein
VLDRHRIPFRPITEHDVRGVTGKPHDECIREVFADARGRIPFLHAAYGFGASAGPDLRFTSFSALTGYLLDRPLASPAGAT